MKALSIVVLSSAFALLTGCNGGFALRNPAQYSKDTQALFDGKRAEMQACYDGVLKGAPTAAGKVAVKFTWEKSTGKLINPAVDAGGSTAPAPVQECVTKSLNGLVLNPGDAKQGDGTWVFEFKANAPAAPPKT
jgi:hypothetical protein